MKVVIFKLITGEEVVAKLVNQNDEALVVEKAQTIMLTQQGPRFLPFFFAAAGAPVAIYKYNLVTEPMEASMELRKVYEKATSDIEIPDAVTSKIITSKH